MFALRWLLVTIKNRVNRHIKFIYSDDVVGLLYGLSSWKLTYIFLTPLNLTFMLENWGLQGYTLFFLFLLKNIDCGYSLEPPRRGGSNEYPQSMFWAEIWKISAILSENVQFLVVKFSIYLNRRVFVKCMSSNVRVYSEMCAQRRLKSTCASAQFVQSLHCPY